MNWNDLTRKIEKMTPAQRETNVTFWKRGEFSEPTEIEFAALDHEGVDPNQPYLIE